MTRKLSPEERLCEEGRIHCAAFSAYSDKCRYCALHGGFKFEKCHQNTGNATETGGLF